jgi:hypothetical protein
MVLSIEPKGVRVMEIKYCPKCRTEREKGDNYCVSCGYDFNKRGTYNEFLQQETKSELTHETHEEIQEPNYHGIIPQDHMKIISHLLYKKYVSYMKDIALSNSDDFDYLILSDVDKIFKVSIKGDQVDLFPTEEFNDDEVEWLQLEHGCSDQNNRQKKNIVMKGNTQDESSNLAKKNNGIMLTGFIIGLISIFLHEIGIIPLSGIIISIIGLVTFKEAKHKGLWMGIVGLILNILYFLANAKINGHL